MKRFRAHTHFVYLLCVHSLHMSHVTLAHYCLYFCVFMCLVIRFQLLLGNVRACTLGAYFCVMIAVGECPWLLPWFHQFWWNGGLVLRPGRGMKPPNMTRGFWSFSAVLIGGFQPPNETAVHTWHYLISRVETAVWSAVPKPPTETAECVLFLSGPFCGRDRRSVAAE